VGRGGRVTSAFFLAAALSCNRPAPDDAPGIPRPERQDPPPVDHLRPGELIEGSEAAYTLALPREFYVNSRFTGMVTAEGPGTPEDVANFFRARVKDGRVLVGVAQTRFQGVHTQKEPGRILQILVEPDPRGGARSRVTVEDVTPPPEPPEGQRDPRSRMKSVGLSEDGKVLDPRKLQ
jgi:hypothetical protein